MADANLLAAAQAISAGKAPLRLTDAELQTLSDGAREVPPQARSAFARWRGCSRPTTAPTRSRSRCGRCC